MSYPVSILSKAREFRTNLERKRIAGAGQYQCARKEKKCRSQKNKMKYAAVSPRSMVVGPVCYREREVSSLPQARDGRRQT